MPSAVPHRALQSALVYQQMSEAELAQLEAIFDHVDYVPVDGFHLTQDSPSPSAEQLARCTTLICVQLPPVLKHCSQTLLLDFIHIIVSGTGHITNSTFWRSLPEGHNILFANATGLQVSSIGEHALAGVLMLQHKLNTLVIEAARTQAWVDVSAIGLGSHFVRELRGQTVGLLGYGAIARETARMFASMGCTIHAATRDGTIKPIASYRIVGTGDPEGQLPRKVYSTSSAESLEAFFASCDVVINALPSSPTNRNIVGESALRAMKDDAILVNVGRGDTVDTEALVAALQASVSPAAAKLAALNGGLTVPGQLKIGGASLDVVAPEPLTPGHPLFALQNCIITPHSAGLSTAYLTRAVELIGENVERVRSGRAIVNEVKVW